MTVLVLDLLARKGNASTGKLDFFLQKKKFLHYLQIFGRKYILVRDLFEKLHGNKDLLFSDEQFSAYVVNHSVGAELYKETMRSKRTTEKYSRSKVWYAWTAMHSAWDYY